MKFTVVVTCSGSMFVIVSQCTTEFRLIRLRGWDFQTDVSAGLLFLELWMSPDMLLEVVTTHKAFATLSADKPFLTHVDSYVSL